MKKPHNRHIPRPCGGLLLFSLTQTQGNNAENLVRLFPSKKNPLLELVDGICELVNLEFEQQPYATQSGFRFCPNCVERCSFVCQHSPGLAFVGIQKIEVGQSNRPIFTFGEERWYIE